MAIGMATDHIYRCDLVWQGSTAAGYAGYVRTHEVRMPPALGEFTLSSDAAFRGNPELANPEQLLLAAASSCQLLSFLAVAARGHVDVLGYEDDAEAVMPEASRPRRITRITLRPRITVAAGTDERIVAGMVERAHEECYVANTLTAEVVVDATISVASETVAP